MSSSFWTKTLRVNHIFVDSYHSCNGRRLNECLEVLECLLSSIEQKHQSEHMFCTYVATLHMYKITLFEGDERSYYCMQQFFRSLVVFKECSYLFQASGSFRTLKSSISISPVVFKYHLCSICAIWNITLDSYFIESRLSKYVQSLCGQFG